MPSHGVRLRVHLAPVGFEVHRVVDPVLRLRADVVILFTISATDRAVDHVRAIQEILREKGVRNELLFVDLKNPSAVVDAIGNIVNGATQNEYFMNVSTGAKTACLAGTIASMLWPIQPYYQSVDYSRKPEKGDEDYPTVGEPQFIPTFRVPLLDNTTIRALSIISTLEQPVPKRKLMDKLREKEIIAPKQKAQATAQALQAQLDVMLRKLEAWGYVEISGRGSQFRIKITEKGIAGTVMFSHTLAPRPLPASLR